MRIGLEGRLGLMVVKPKSLLPWRVVAVVLALSSIFAGVLLATAGVAFASTTGWVRLCNSVSCKLPPALSDTTMVYDAATKQVVLFGGYGYGVQSTTTSTSSTSSTSSVINGTGTKSVVLGQTWTWNGSTWTQAHPAKSPPPLFGGSTAYDTVTRQVVLFGGINNNGLIGNTWIWNGSTWAQAHPAKSPPARMDASMAYDASSRQVVLFGGSTYGGSFLNDTWTWNGSTWTQQSSASTSGAASGASGGSVTSPTLFPSSTSSTSSAPSGTSPGIVGRSYAPAAYYAPARRVVLFGGYAYVGYDSGMWGYSFSSAHPAGALEPAAKQSSSVSGKSTWNVVIGAILIALASAGLVAVSALWIIRRRRASGMVV